MRTERAQWRGLDFDWLDETHSGGNRLAIHKYVDRDTHSVKPIGCEEERWTVRGYICGDRLRDRVRDFREAFKRRGPGRLYDPWQNEDFNVYVENWSITPNSNILGTEFSATFVDAGEDPYPIATLSPLAAFADAVEQLEVDSVASFSSTFSVIGDRSGSVGFALSDADQAWDYIRDSYRIGYEPGSQIQIDGLSGVQVISGGHADALQAVFDDIDGALSDFRAREFYARNIYVGLPSPDPFGPAAAAAIENSEAVEALVARMSFARISAIIINSAYRTREHAQEAVDTLSGYAAALRRFSGPCDDPAISRDIQCIMAVASQIPMSLAPLKIWTATMRQSSLVLAHDIYCDIGRAGELADLNNALTALPQKPCYAAD